MVGIESADPRALEEVLAFWPELKAALEELRREGHFRFEGRLVHRIHLHEPLNRRGDHGIVLHLGEGDHATRVVWGMAGEVRYGIDHATRIEHLAHTLACQGTSPLALRGIREINVRFSEPFAVVEDGRRVVPD